MPCDTRQRAIDEEERRQKQIEDLISGLKAKSIRLSKVGNTLSIEGWAERGEWCDECAVRALKVSGDMEVRRMLASALPVGQAMTFGHGHEHV